MTNYDEPEPNGISCTRQRLTILTTRELARLTNFVRSFCLYSGSPTAARDWLCATPKLLGWIMRKCPKSALGLAIAEDALTQSPLTLVRCTVLP
jgi:hypothetical protein